MEQAPSALEPIAPRRPDLPLESSVFVDNINDILDDLATRPGVRVEVCSVANRSFGISNASNKPNFQVVGNKWVSLIASQS